MTATRILEAQWYSLAELRWQLSRVRGKRVPERTLRWWLQELCIEPNECGLYAVSDLQVLTRLVLFLKQHRLATQTRLHRSSTFCLFDPRLVDQPDTGKGKLIELLDPTHPLIQWIKHSYENDAQKLQSFQQAGNLRMLPSTEGQLQKVNRELEIKKKLIGDRRNTDLNVVQLAAGIIFVEL